MLISVHAWWPSYTNTKTYFELKDIRSIGSKPHYEVSYGARVPAATLSRRHGILFSPVGAFFNCGADNCFIIEVTSVSVIDEGWGSLGATGLFHNIWPNLDPIVAKNTEGERGWGETARWTCCTNLKHHNCFLNPPSTIHPAKNVFVISHIPRDTWPAKIMVFSQQAWLKITTTCREIRKQQKKKQEKIHDARRLLILRYNAVAILAKVKRYSILSNICCSKLS